MEWAKGQEQSRQNRYQHALASCLVPDFQSALRLDSEEFVTVDAISLTSLLKNIQYDYFSLDIEGAELEILKNLDWSTIKKPFFMTIEHNGRPGELDSLVALLAGNGYAECFSDYTWLRRHDIWCELVIK